MFITEQLLFVFDTIKSRKGTQRLTLVKEGENWRAGVEIEQIGIIQQEVVDLPGEVISEVRKQNIAENKTLFRVP